MKDEEILKKIIFLINEINDISDKYNLTININTLEIANFEGKKFTKLKIDSITKILF